MCGQNGDLLAILQVIDDVRSSFESIEGNHKRCGILMKRCEHLEEILTKISNSGKSPEARSSISKELLEATNIIIHDCRGFMERYGKTGWKRFVVKLFDHKRLESEFLELNMRLDSAVNDLHFAKDVSDEQIHQANEEDMKEQLGLLKEMVANQTANVIEIRQSLNNGLNVEKKLETIYHQNEAVMDQKKSLLELIHEQLPTSTKRQIYEETLKNLDVVKDLEFGDMIGSGSFGAVTVHRGKLHEHDVAIKKFEKVLINATEKEVKQLKREALIMSMVDHPNIIRFLGVSLDRGVLVMEIGISSLFEVLHQHKPLPIGYQITDTKVCFMLLYDVSSALYYLHLHDILHRDVKSQNIILMMTSEGKITAKLTDFGVAVALGFTLSTSGGSQAAAVKNKNTEAVGSKRYMAPELILAEELVGGVQYTPAVDVYALGITANEMFTRQPPFEGLSDLGTKQYYRIVVEGLC